MVHFVIVLLIRRLHWRKLTLRRKSLEFTSRGKRKKRERRVKVTTTFVLLSWLLSLQLCGELKSKLDAHYFVPSPPPPPIPWILHWIHWSILWKYNRPLVHCDEQFTNCRSLVMCHDRALMTSFTGTAVLLINKTRAHNIPFFHETVGCVDDHGSCSSLLVWGKELIEYHFYDAISLEALEQQSVVDLFRGCR